VRRVALIHSDDTDTPETPERAKMVNSLLASLDLLPRMAVCERATCASADDLLAYHQRDYIAVLEAAGRAADDASQPEPDQRDLEQHGLEFDASAFPALWTHATRIAGGSLRAAELLCAGECDVAMHWQGGRHHATADRAAGFCYANDVVLATLRLLRVHRCVVILDLDIHHGDGTEEAFRHSGRVLNVSFHQFAPGFYPGTGALAESGSGRGKNATVNVPLRPGVSSATFSSVFETVAAMCRAWAGDRACAVVVQCGADGLAGDPRGGFNLSPAALAAAVGTVLDWRLPTLLLGGGGYVPENAARAWALCSIKALAMPDPPPDAQIPDSDEFYERYRSGSFLLCATSSAAHGPPRDENDDAYVRELLTTLSQRFEALVVGERLAPGARVARADGQPLHGSAPPMAGFKRTRLVATS
jgi:histone deacetylase 8